MAAARVIPGVCGVLLSSSPACTIFTPCSFQSMGRRPKSGNNLDFAFEFVIIAEVDDVVAAVAAPPLTAQVLGMDRKQKRLLANQHVRIINRGLDCIQWEI